MAAYSTAVNMQQSQSLLLRVTAAVAKENFTPSPAQWAADQMWFLVADTNWQTEWERGMKQADDAKFNPDIGARPDIITDLMILGGIQARKGYLDSLEQPAP
jgi:hypothetical protein